MSASEYPGVEKEAQRLIDQFTAMMAGDDAPLREDRGSDANSSSSSSSGAGDDDGDDDDDTAVSVVDRGGTRCETACIGGADRGDGRPPVACATTCESTRVVDVKYGIGDEGDDLVIDEAHLASTVTNLNSEPYETSALLAYLYAEQPDEKSVPHTRQRLTRAQVNALLALMADGQAHIVAPPDVDYMAYALSRPLVPADDADVAAQIDARIEDIVADGEAGADASAYLVAALEHWAIEVAMALGWRCKPAINFGMARYISAASTPLLAERGGLLPDEVPRRHCGGHGLMGDLDGAAATVAASAAAAAAESLLEGRDEAVARHRTTADHRRRHPPMGMDLELVAALLQIEAGGLEPCPANLGEMRRRLKLAARDRIKATKVDRKIDRYAVPWAYGMCCALDRRDIDETLASPEGAASVRDRVQCVWASEVVRGGQDALTGSLGRKPPRPIAAYLSDTEYRQRIERLDPALMAALLRVIPLEARGRTDVDVGDYIVYESNLGVGALLSPPMRHSLAQKVMRFDRRAGASARACDVASKPPPIVFVRDCPPSAPPGA